jgi:DNA-directed RNA polymerase-3 subunit RPC5
MGDVGAGDVPMGGMGIENDDSPDSDPIKATYDVFIKPSISDGRQIYILQFPNRESSQKYNEANGSGPQKLRIKPDAGMVELDVPLDVRRSYDRAKGIKWGEAMKKSNMIQGGRTHGLPGGFGIGGVQPAGRGRGRGEAEQEIDQDTLLADFEGAIERGQVLEKQTLGGQTLFNEETMPQYMVGTFYKSKFV